MSVLLLSQAINCVSPGLLNALGIDDNRIKRIWSPQCPGRHNWNHTTSWYILWGPIQPLLGCNKAIFGILWRIRKKIGYGVWGYTFNDKLKTVNALSSVHQILSTFQYWMKLQFLLWNPRPVVLLGPPIKRSPRNADDVVIQASTLSNSS